MGTVTLWFCALYACTMFILESMLVLGYSVPGYTARFIPLSGRVNHLVSESRTALSAGNSITDVSKKVSLYCNALGLLGDALRISPYDGRLLLNWANIRQLLGRVECHLPYTTGNTQAVVDIGLAREQANPSVVYAGGLIALWSGDAKNARRLFNQFLRFGMGITAGQEELIQSTMSVPSDISEVVPASFPQILTWTEKLRQDPRFWYTQEISEQSTQVLKSLQLKALDENRHQYQTGIIPEDVYEGRLYDLLYFSLIDEVRKIVDAEIAHFKGGYGTNTVQRFFLERSTLEEIPVARSLLLGDRKPLKSSFSSWGNSVNVRLHETHTSVGFFLPEKAHPSTIVFRGRDASVIPSIASLSIYVSEDNITWDKISEGVESSTFVFHEHPFITLKIPKDRYHYRYWKFQFEKTGGIRFFGDYLSKLVTVYGLPKNK